jgi:chemotaxis protein MotB
MSHGGGGDRWLVSYADFITLLMVLFVVLYSMGQVDVEKYKQLAGSLRAAFAFGGPSKVVDAQINMAGGKSEEGQPNPIIVPGIPQKPTDAEEVAGDLANMLADSNLGSEVSVQTNVDGVLISLSEKLIFTPGTASLQEAAYPVLDTIVGMMKQNENTIKVVGHTDNTPSADPRYPTNWELSSARAQIIANYMIQTGIAPERLIVSGRGEYEPVFSNDTPEHRALNSRADIIVVYRIENDIISSESIFNP